MKKMIFLCCLIGSTGFGQAVDFYKEDITFRLTKNHFYVNGDYLFRNSNGRMIKTLVFYPFDDTDERVVIDSLTLMNMTKCCRQDVLKKNKNGFFFELALGADDTVQYHIGYRQNLTSDSVKYILKTTQYWKKPLECAEYKLWVDDPVRIQSISYKPDSVYQFDQTKIFYLKKKNFMPDIDMVIHYIIEQNTWIKKETR